MSCWGLCYRALLGHEFHPEKSLNFWGEILGYVEAKLGQIGGWKATSTEACWVGVGLGSILGLCCGHLEVVCWANLVAKSFPQRANVATTLFLCHCLWVTYTCFSCPQGESQVTPNLIRSKYWHYWHTLDSVHGQWSASLLFSFWHY